MQLAQILPADAVLSHLQVRDKKQALKYCAAAAAKITNLSEKEIYAVLMEREASGCTAMGSGVSVPHGRIGELSEPLAIFAQLDTPIEFGAADGKKVDLIFLLLTPLHANTEHLKALSLVSKVLRDKVFCTTLRHAPDAPTLHAMLMNYYQE